MSTVDFTDALWRKSSRSGQGNNGDCVEVAHGAPAVGVRDSKHTSSVLAFTPTAWRTFLHSSEVVSTLEC